MNFDYPSMKYLKWEIIIEMLHDFLLSSSDKISQNDFCKKNNVLQLSQQTKSSIECKCN